MLVPAALRSTEQFDLEEARHLGRSDWIRDTGGQEHTLDKQRFLDTFFETVDIWYACIVHCACSMVSG